MVFAGRLVGGISPLRFKTGKGLGAHEGFGAHVFCRLQLEIQWGEHEAPLSTQQTI